MECYRNLKFYRQIFGISTLNGTLNRSPIRYIKLNLENHKM